MTRAADPISSPLLRPGQQRTQTLSVEGAVLACKVQSCCRAYGIAKLQNP